MTQLDTLPGVTPGRDLYTRTRRELTNRIHAPRRHSMKRFQLLRHTDISGVSGTGVVAEGIQFTDGTVVVRWYGDNPSTVVWASIMAAVAIHGHNGSTEVVWIDEQ